MVLGRTAELAQLRGLLDRTERGSGGALILRGDAGVGRSTLLEATAAMAADFRVLRVAGTPSGASMAYTGLRRLLGPVLATGDATATELRRALEPDLDAPVRTISAYTAALHLLVALSDQQAVLCLVDDAQWLDHSSAEGLGFVARRLDGAKVALLFVLRTEDDTARDLAGIPTLSVPGLDEQSASELLQRATEPLATPVARELIALTAGNPLALLELPTVLTDAQRAGIASLDQPLPVGAQVQAGFRHRVGALSAAGQRALHVVAESDGDLPVVSRALETDLAGIDQAERAGLITTRGDVVMLAHPLLRSALRSAAPDSARRRAHEDLAAALSQDPYERGVWHRAAAAQGSDDTLAAELEAAAERVGRRSPVDRYRFAERAARLSGTPVDQARRLVVAGRAAHASGLRDEASALIAEGMGLTDDPCVRADLLDAAASIARADGRTGSETTELLREAERVAPFDKGRALRLACHAWQRAAADLDLGRSREILDSARSLLPTGDPSVSLPLLEVLARQGIWDADLEQDGIAAAKAGAGAELAATTMSEHSVSFGACCAGYGEPRLGRQVLERAASQGQDRGDGVLAIRALSALTLVDLQDGQPERAAVHADTALRLARDAGVDCWHALALASVAQVQAMLGLPAGRETATTAVGLARRCQDRGSELLALDAMGRLDLAFGEAAAACSALEQVCGVSISMADPRYLPAAPDLIEAYARLGRGDRAREIQGGFEQQVTTRYSPWGRAAVTRTHALLCPLEDADVAFMMAADAARGEGVPRFEYFRTELTWGERLRRGGQHRTARIHLERALAGFEGLGAGGWADRTREELRAAGHSVAPALPVLIQSLTPRELQITMLAADGATNQEIATRLYLSPRTVEAHLGRVYRKLGVRSRTELARAVPAA